MFFKSFFLQLHVHNIKSELMVNPSESKATLKKRSRVNSVKNNVSPTSL